MKFVYSRLHRGVADGTWIYPTNLPTENSPLIDELMTAGLAAAGWSLCSMQNHLCCGAEASRQRTLGCGMVRFSEQYLCVTGYIIDDT